ncbi:D-alanine--D-alanine ligase [Reinekea forsetii]|uniref:D-alanine--D-alanine ligase n=1 Tax=Reinekea forsetii TaxID=1336806 RepID=A0A2K8KSV8_9GAMM|nr:D-alanine--D-alanine ligase [Reinekea forsetii]ATX77793.1 D-alanine--D-alanine ligase [Reinekea forsetii]
MSTRFNKVAVLFGGLSAEREVALLSGRTVIKALLTAGYEVVELDLVDRSLLLPWLAEHKPDVVFPVLHGRMGEDGVLQGLLEWVGIPFVGSGVMGSAIAMDKLRSKMIFKTGGVPTPDFVVVRSQADALIHQARLCYPVFVKPVREGSSIGIGRADNQGEFMSAVTEALNHDTEVLVEQFVDGPEYTVGIIGAEVLPVIRLKPHARFYDYDAKYVSEDTEYHLPSGLSAELEGAVQAMSLMAFAALGCTGWGRVDLMMDGQGALQVLEVNTIPGMTDHSLVPKAASAYGWDLPELMHKLLATVK